MRRAKSIREDEVEDWLDECYQDVGHDPAKVEQRIVAMFGDWMVPEYTPPSLNSEDRTDNREEWEQQAYSTIGSNLACGEKVNPSDISFFVETMWREDIYRRQMEQR